MSSFIIWGVMGLTAVGVERALVPRRQGVPTDHGRLLDQIMIFGTAVAYGGPPIAAVIAPARESLWVMAVATCLAVGGVVIRGLAIKTLGRRYQLTPMTIPGEDIVVQNGVYSLVRHPGYAGLIIGFLGISLSFSNPFCILFVFPMIGFVIWRIRFEEQSLELEFGKRYQSYERSVKWRLIPGVF